MPANAVHEVVRQLSSRRDDRANRSPLPSRKKVADLLEIARFLLLPDLLPGDQNSADERLEGLFERFRDGLRRQLRRAAARDGKPQDADDITDKLIRRLPLIQSLLHSDLEAALDGDPALHSVEEAALCYPGIVAVTCYRVAHELHQLGVPLLPRMMTELAHSKTGIDIHPGAQIGRRFFIDHGTGVVIGGTAVIGDNVRLYQGVTLGAKSFPVDDNGRVLKDRPRHPILKDDVVVYSGASILGRITIGQGAVIGGNVWVTRDVPAGARVSQAKPRRVGFVGGDGI